MGFSENENSEYTSLCARGRDAERTWQLCWTAAGLVASVVLSWGIAARSPGLMAPVVVAAGFGFYSMIRGRQQSRLIAGYIEEFYEKSPGGPRWFSRLSHLQSSPAYTPTTDWFMTGMANVVVVLAVAFAWLYSGNGQRGELLASAVTGLGVAFVFHSISATAQLHRCDYLTFWRQVNQGPSAVPREVTREASAGIR